MAILFLTSISSKMPSVLAEMSPAKRKKWPDMRYNCIFMEKSDKTEIESDFFA